MATSPQYAATPRASFVVLSAANTARDGSGTLETVITAGANGTRIERIIIQATGTTTAGQVRLWLHDGTNGRLMQEVLVSAITASGTVLAFRAEASTAPYLVLPTGWSLRATTHNAEGFVVTALGADL